MSVGKLDIYHNIVKAIAYAISLQSAFLNHLANTLKFQTSQFFVFNKFLFNNIFNDVPMQPLW